jgi:hypothetical protein
MAEARERWCIVLRPERRPVPAIIRLRHLLKCAKRAYGIICERLDVPAEMRQLQARLVMLTEENEHLRARVAELENQGEANDGDS